MCQQSCYASPGGDVGQRDDYFCTMAVPYSHV
jgi:hypothetical protein